MNTAYRGIAVLTVCLLLVGASGVLAQDWPQWRGPNRDGRVAEFTAPETWPATLTQQWRTVVGAGDATPALVGDRLYVWARQGNDEVTLCLNAADGTEIWRSTTEAGATAVTGAPSSHPGPRSSPAVAEGKVVTLGVGGILSCTDAETGALVWRKDLFANVVPRFYTASSPLIVDGMVIAQLGGQGNGGILAFDLATGEEKWRWVGEAPEYASPVLMTVDDTRQIVALTEKSVVGVSLADGALLWQLPFAPSGRAYNAATPIVDGQTVIYTGAGRGTHAVKIEKQGEGFAATEVWANPDLAPQFNTPVLAEGLLFGLTNRGSLFCLNAITGQTAWTDESQRGQGGFGAIVSAGPVLFALPSDGWLLVYKPSATGYEEIARYQVAQAGTYAHPVISGNRIFIKDQDAVSLWTLP